MHPTSMFCFCPPPPPFGNDGNPWLMGAGVVSKDKKASSSQLGDAMGFGKGKLYFHSCEPSSTSNKTEY
jgi:hypothetical protein